MMWKLHYDLALFLFAEVFFCHKRLLRFDTEPLILKLIECSEDPSFSLSVHGCVTSDRGTLEFSIDDA